MYQEYSEFIVSTFFCCFLTGVIELGTVFIWGAELVFSHVIMQNRSAVGRLLEEEAACENAEVEG